MPRTIQVELSNDGIKNAIKELKQYALWVQVKEAELRSKLARVGYDVASIQFSGATYDGVNDVTVRVDDTGSVAVIYAEGTSVAFIEFGSGIKYGYGHPQAGEFGLGPGTWSDSENGKGHWDNPKGWYYAHGQRSFGNPPAMAMYNAAKEITENVTRIAREVFAT